MTENRARRRYTLAILLAVYACNFMDRQILASSSPRSSSTSGSVAFMCRRPSASGLP
jgi:hypothetical protein